jgi:hypothetical protein
MGTTSPLGFPYPETGDTPDVPRDVKALAEAVNDDVDTLDGRADGLDTKTNSTNGRVNTLEGEMNTVEGRATALENPSWNAWNPNWYSSDGFPTIGNGKLDGRYTMRGTLVHARFRLQIGTTSFIHTSNFWQFSLPVGLVVIAIGSGYFVDVGGFWKTLTCVATVDGRLTFMDNADGTTVLGSTYNSGLGLNDQIYGSITYSTGW